MLYHSVNARCILEINQENADGYTSRFLEAIMFNKRIITDNESVKLSEFYSDKNIQIITDYTDVNASFILNPEKIDYNYNGQFSPVNLLKRIEDILC